jgi:hypothetical protein
MKEWPAVVTVTSLLSSFDSLADITILPWSIIETERQKEKGLVKGKQSR